MMAKRSVKFLVVFISVFIIGLIFVLSAFGSNERVVFVRDGGMGDGSDYENAIGDFKEAVRVLSRSGGKIVICGKYTYTELISLSKRSGTSNGNNTITVTSVHDGIDYRVTQDASLCSGNKNSSGNIILAGKFVFEELAIRCDGDSKKRAIICSGYDTEFGNGIVCSKKNEAPYISIVGVALGDAENKDCKITVKSGTYDYVCAGSRSGQLKGNTSLVIDGGIFEGNVSVSGFEGGKTQDGNAELTVNGGTFLGDVGALGEVDGDFDFTVNGGNFRKRLLAYGDRNTVEINGGNLQGISGIFVGGSLSGDWLDETTGNVDEQSVVYVNQYIGNVEELVNKISGQGFTVVVNTEGGADTEKKHTDVTTVPVTETEKSSTETSKKEEEITDKINEEHKKEYFLGSRKMTVVAIIGISSLFFMAVVVFAYRIVHRKNK